MLTDDESNELASRAEAIRETPVPQPRGRGWLRGEKWRQSYAY